MPIGTTPNLGDVHVFPATYSQRRLFFLDQLQPGDVSYLVPWSIRISGALDVEALEQSLNEIICRHESLRTSFAVEDGDVVQVVAASRRINLRVEDLSAFPKPEEVAGSRVLEESRRPLDLAAGPLIRAALLRISPAEHILLLTLHHIIFDRWSRGILARELSALYQAFRNGEPSPLPSLRLQYPDYAVWQREYVHGGVLQKHLDYWRQQLDGAPGELALPADRARLAVQSSRGARKSVSLSERLTKQLMQLSQRQGATLFMTLLTAFDALLSRYSGQTDVVVGTPIANRNRAQLEGIIGLFANVLALRLDLSGDLKFSDLIQRARKMTLAAYEHQDMPLETLVEELNPERSLSHNPLFQVLFSLGNVPTHKLELDGLDLQWTGTAEVASKLDIAVFLQQQSERVVGQVEYNKDLFDESTIDRMLGHYQVLLESVVENPDLRLSELPLLTTREREQILLEWNATAADYPRDLCLHQLIERQASSTPDAVACVFDQEQLSYRELNERANQLAHYLKQRGMGPGQRVGVFVERSLAMMTALLGVQKSGAAYVPLDPAYPADRIRITLEEARPPVLITQSSLLDRLPGDAAEVVCLDRDAGVIARQERLNPSGEATPEDLVYVIFTSGSTGRPKGVQIPHRAVVNLLWCMKEQLRIGPDDALPALASFAFDMCIPELYLPLISGGRVVVGTRELAADGEALAEFLRSHAATMVHATPTTWSLLLDAGFTDRGLKRVIGAEALPQDLCRRLLEVDDTLYNYYGPTETTVWSAMHCFRSPDEPVVVGRPIANTQIYVLDDSLQPVPIGVTGEIFIGGEGVARGYLNQNDLTAERFLLDPFTHTSGRTMYRTGDLGRFLPDGRIEFRGRRDNQVKIRGFRIELGEIETVLRQHPSVTDTAVVVREDVPGDKRLVSYVVTSDHTVRMAELRAFAKARLPEYMVPAAWVQLDRLPLTPNGKVDRRNLPEPAELRQHEPGYVEPRSPAEEVIAEIWAEVLKLDRVGSDDNFFQLGGHSLLAMQVVSRIRRAFEVDLPLRALFEAPTVAGLAQRTTDCQRQKLGFNLPLRPTKQEGPLPLSYAQERLWFLSQLESQAPYNVPYIVRLRGPLKVPVLESSLQQIIDRHETLRTRFDLLNGAPVQLIDPDSKMLLSLTDLSDREPLDRENEARRQASDEAARPFDLRTGPLLRACLWKLSEDDHVLALTTHHIISDQWSVALLWEELRALYKSGIEGLPSQLEPLAVQYADFSLWQREFLADRQLANQLAYWAQQLAGAPPALELPTDHPRPALENFHGAQHAVVLSPELLESVRKLSRREGVTLYMTLLGAFSAMLSRYSGQDDIVVGSPIAGRNQTELENLIGLFVNTLVLRTNLAGNPTFQEVLSRVRETAMGAYAHHDVPFEKVVEELHPARSLNRNPLFQVMLVLQNRATENRDFADLACEVFPIEKRSSKFDLTLIARERSDGLLVAFEYNTNLFDTATIKRMCGHFQALLEGAVADPTLRLFELPLLTATEREQVLVEWNATASDYPRDRCIHELFEQQATRTPDAIACVFEQKQLTYRDLNRRSNQLAHYLRRQGVKPESLVALCLERSLDMLVAMLGTLKAGGAYVPIDPAYPKERKRFILEDSGALLRVTQSSLASDLAGEGICISLDQDWSEISQQPESKPSIEVVPENLAYVIYTSGSTGQPKGVQITHCNVVNFLSSMRQSPGLASTDTLLAVTTLSFDIAGLELYLPLTVGAKVVIASRLDCLDGRRLAELMETCQATVLQATPATWRMLLEVGWTGNPQLKALCGGEAIPAELVRQLLPRCGELWNMYGPTETTIWSSIYRIESAEAGVIPIGRPIANTTLFILDAQKQPVPVGVPGELYIGGDGVGRGYLNRPELASQKFVQDLFFSDGRLYATGDLARYRPDGTVEFLRRTDDQVKVRGFRIELGEIESVLAGQPGVKACAVVVREDIPENKELVAYVVGGEETISAMELRRSLRSFLPDYMVPSRLVLVPALPLTPNGKVNRKALAAREYLPSESEVGYVAPRTPLEESLVAIWSEVLQRPRVGVNDDFFDLGGHSFLAVRLWVRMEQELKVKLPLNLLFLARTVAQIAARISDFESTRSSEKRSIIPCRAGGTKPPIYAAPPGVGLEVLLAFKSLADRLEPDQPMYAFAELEADREWTSLEELAAHYIRDLREFQPNGPYHLVGWSFGGMIAFEMARQLRAQNLEVGLLGMLDASNLTVLRGKRTRLQRLRRALRYNRNLIRGRLWALKAQGLSGLSHWPRALAKLMHEFRQFCLLALWRELYRLYQGLLNRNLPAPVHNLLLHGGPRGFKRAYPNLVENYKPKFYPGKLVLFQSEGKLESPPLLGWSGLAEEVEVVSVAGNHFSMLDEPHVGILASEITRALSRISAAPSEKTPLPLSARSQPHIGEKESPMIAANPSFSG